MKRAKRRFATFKIIKKRHNRNSWVEEPGKFKKKSTFRRHCTCSWCSSNRTHRNKMCKEDLELVRGIK